jgi:hypothetical protein
MGIPLLQVPQRRSVFETVMHPSPVPFQQLSPSPDGVPLSLPATTTTPPPTSTTTISPTTTPTPNPARARGRPRKPDIDDPAGAQHRSYNRKYYQENKDQIKTFRIAKELLANLGPKGAAIMDLLAKATRPKKVTKRANDENAVQKGVNTLFAAFQKGTVRKGTTRAHKQNMQPLMNVLGSAGVSAEFMQTEWGATASQAQQARRTKSQASALDSNLVTSRYPARVKRDKVPKVLKQAIGSHIFGLTFTMSGSRTESRCLTFGMQEVYEDFRTNFKGLVRDMFTRDPDMRAKPARINADKMTRLQKNLELVLEDPDITTAVWGKKRVGQTKHTRSHTRACTHACTHTHTWSGGGVVVWWWSCSGVVVVWWCGGGVTHTHDARAHLFRLSACARRPCAGPSFVAPQRTVL